MDPNSKQQQQQSSSSSSRALQFHPSRPSIIDLFNLYLGRNNDRQKSDDSTREPPNKAQKRITALNKELPPPNEQFLIDFEQLQRQFVDRDQLRAVTESVLISLVVQCSGHAPRAEFLLFALRSLSTVGYINWDTFLPSLLSAVSSTEMSVSQGVNNAAALNTIPSSSNPTSPLTGIGSPAFSATEALSNVNLSPVKSSDVSGNAKQPSVRVNSTMRDNAISNLRQLCCKIVLAGLVMNLKPVTHADILYHMLSWLVNWDQRQNNLEESDGANSSRPDKALIEWLHSCLDVIWLLVEEDKCRVPFYELLRSGLQFIENIPDDESLFSLILEIHRRRDMMATHMQMLDQHLHCPTFGTHRYLSLNTHNTSGEAVSQLRCSPITYPSVLGEPLHGEDVALSVQRGSLDWERALRCIKHALRTTPSPDWWKRVLLVTPCYRPSTQLLSPGAVFTPEMISEATIDRIFELLKLINSEVNCWQEWLGLSDIFFFLVKSGCIDFIDFVDKLAARVTGDHLILRTNHVTWMLAEIIRVELVMNALNTDPRKVETTRKLLSFHREDKNCDPNNPQSILLDYISSCQNLRIWSLNTSTREYLNSEQLQKGKQIDEWWRQVSKGERMMDYMNLDDRSIGMFWVVSYTMAAPACDTVMSWLSSAGTAELLPGSNVPPNERLMAMRETNPLPIALMSGFSKNLCLKVITQMEEAIFSGQVVPSIAMVETYCRMLLLAPHSLFRSHFSHLVQKNTAILSKPASTIVVLEILNYRLFPLYRYAGKAKPLMYDVTKIVSTLRGKRGDHRIFRLAENLCMNLILSLRDFFTAKREGKGPTEFSETLNRITVISLAIIIKTRGIAEADQILYLPPMIEQIMATSQHTWSEKTLRFFPTIVREVLLRRTDKRGQAIQAWQQAETTVINQCTQLLSPSADPSYVMTYISHSFPQHRQYLCAGAGILMHGHPENINSANLARVLREFSPEEVTSNIYTMVDVILHHINVDLQRGHSLQDLIHKACANISFFIWTHEILPMDILLLALIDRDDDPHALRIVISLLDRQELQQRVKLFCMNRGPSEHWQYSGIFKRIELTKALGNHLSWKDRAPTFFDDIAARLLPVIPLIVYRLIENDAVDLAEGVLAMYSAFLTYYPLRFSFVRDLLAYFYGYLPGKLIVRILNVLDLSKIPFSESFPQHIRSTNPSCPPLDYFMTLLLGLVNNVIPSLNSHSKSGSMGDAASTSTRGPLNNKTPPNIAEGQKPFYLTQDPGTHTQLVLDTAVIELLSLPVTASQIVTSLVQIVVHIQSTIIQSSNGLHGNTVGQGTGLPNSPSGGSIDSVPPNRSNPLIAGINTAKLISRSGYSCQQLSCLMIQACGLLLAQLPPDFHVELYMEASRIIKESWWLTDVTRSSAELDSAVGYALLDPTWAAQDNTSTAIGNVVALLHSFFSNLPLEWLEGTHIIIKQLRPVTSVAMLRIAFRIMGPLLLRLVNAHTLFNKTLALLLDIMVIEYGSVRLKDKRLYTRMRNAILEVYKKTEMNIESYEIFDVFGKNSQTNHVDASEIADLVDFIHHIVHYEGQGGPVQANSKPRPEVLAICGRAFDGLRPEDVALSVQRGSLDWERALRCIKHALRTTPSPDWWKRVLLVTPCYRPSTQLLSPGAVFTPEMISEATIDRIFELLKLINSEVNCWQEWLGLSDIFFFLVKSGCIDFIDFVDKLAARVTGDHLILRTNHVTWMLAEIIRVELVMNALNTDPRKVETTRKLLSFHREDKNCDPNNPQSILLDYISSCQNLRIWSLNTSTREYLNSEQLQKGKQIDEWWRQVSKGERMMDYMNLDDRSIGMFWVVSYTMAAPACDTVMSWLSSAGTAELLPGSNVPPNERLMAMRETNPLPIALMSGFSKNLCLKVITQMEEAIFSGQVVPSIAMVETYCRMLLLAPHSLFRSHFSHLVQKNTAILSKPASTIVVLEILNYRLFPLYRYAGKAKPLMYDVTKIVSTLRGKRGDHRIFRLAENLCMNLILSLRDFFTAKREGKGPTEFSETLNRITVISLAIIIKTRGIAEADQILYLPPMIEQIMATSQHTWSEKTLRFFPTIVREVLLRRTDKRGQAIQAWQQAETTVINQCTQLLSPSADPSYVMTYISHSFPQHRQYLCAGAGILMHGHPENINSANLARVLREFSPEEVTSNIYTMVDVILHHINVDLQRGHSLQDLIHKACANISFFIWTHEILPMDILLLALIDRDDDPHALRIVISLLDRQELQQRVKLFCMNRGPSEHWQYSGIFKRIELTKALGNHLSWKDRAPTFFDDIAARLLPVIPLIVYRLIENDAVDLAEGVLAMYSAFLTYYPLRFSFVRDLLAYFYGYLPGKLIVRILNVLDLSKIPFSESFPQHIRSTNPSCPPLDYFMTLLLGLVNNVIPSLNSHSKSGSMGDAASTSTRGPLNNKTPPNIAEGQKPFYLTQDPGTHTQLVLDTAVIELLSLPVTASQIVTSLVQIVVHIQSTIIQSSNGLHGNTVGQGTGLPNSPSGGSIDSVPPNRSNPLIAGINTAKLISRSGYSCQQLSCLMIQACGLLLAQLPPDFHVELYMEASRIIKESWWLTDVTRSSAELDSAVGYALLDPTWAAQDNTSTAIGNVVALLHSFFSNLPLEWLEGTHIIIKQLRPVTSVAMLRIAFRIMGPLLLRLVNAHTLFNKTLALLLDIMVDVFGKNSQTNHVDASEIADLVDFIHHIVHYEGQGGPVQANSKPRPEVLAICGRAFDGLRPEVHHLLSHLKTDVNSSIYAATHVKQAQNSSS